MDEKSESRYGVVTSVTVRNNRKVLGPVLKLVRAFCTGIGLAPATQERAARLVEEMLGLRIDEAYQGVGSVMLNILLEPAHVGFRVADAGVPYRLSDEAGDAQRRVLALAQRWHMDVEPGRGQAITFEFAYDDADFDVETLRRAFYPTEELLDDTVTVRALANSDEEIVQAITCIYSAYGYGYCHEKLYNPDIFKGLLESGELHSYVATNAAGQMLATASLANGELMRSVPDLGTLVTKPFCRGLHIAERLVAHMLGDARALGYAGVRGEPVAFHPFTQKLFSANGMVPTGLLFHAVNPESCGIYRLGNERRDLCCATLCFASERVHRVVLPPEHADFLRGLFGRLGLAIEELSEDGAGGGAEGAGGRGAAGPVVAAEPAAGAVSDAAAEPAAGAPAAVARAASILRSIDATMRTGTLVLRGGWQDDDAAPDLLSGMEEADVVCLYLNMGHTGALNAYRAALEQGFFLTGLAAGAADGDYLVMQHLKGSPLKVSNLVLESDYQELFDYFSTFMDKRLLA